ncbi:MAG: hypothetical protein ACJ75B_10585 [Flavisolibacter sp.]
MKYYVVISFSLSILIAAIIALVRFKSISRVYYPFIYCLWIGSVNEILAVILEQRGMHTLMTNNIYVLLESLLLVWLFKNLSLFRYRPKLYYLLIGLFICGWIAENFVFDSITHNCIYFRIGYSFVVVFMSIHVLNGIITYNDKKLLVNATFMLCTAFIIFFTYKILVYAFLIYGSAASMSFIIHLFLIMVYVNLGTNLLYALAVLWMPRKVEYIR